MASSGGRRGNPALYGGMPEGGLPGMAPRLLEFADELRREGMAVGTSELLDAFEALEAVSWTDQGDFREAIAATRPFAVDTASGTEASPGVKDPAKVAA